MERHVPEGPMQNGPITRRLISPISSRTRFSAAHSSALGREALAAELFAEGAAVQSAIEPDTQPTQAAKTPICMLISARAFSCHDRKTHKTPTLA